MTPRALTFAAYALVALAAVVTELLARSGRVRVPSLTACLAAGMSRRSVQLGLLVAWWWLGWHFVTGA